MRDAKEPHNYPEQHNEEARNGERLFNLRGQPWQRLTTPCRKKAARPQGNTLKARHGALRAQATPCIGCSLTARHASPNSPRPSRRHHIILQASRHHSPSPMHARRAQREGPGPSHVRTPRARPMAEGRGPAHEPMREAQGSHPKAEHKPNTRPMRAARGPQAPQGHYIQTRPKGRKRRKPPISS